MAVFVLSVILVLTTTANAYSMECTTGIPPQYCKDTHTITVQGDCNNVTSFCSLTSAIDYIASTSSGDNWIIEVNYNHSIEQVRVMFNVSCLIICGIGQQQLISVYNTVYFNTIGGFLRLTNIHFNFIVALLADMINFLFNFNFIELSNITVLNGFDWQLSADNITISDSLFDYNYYNNSGFVLKASCNCLLSNVTFMNINLYCQSLSDPPVPISIHIINCHMMDTTANYLPVLSASPISVQSVNELTVASSVFIGRDGSIFDSVIKIYTSFACKVNISYVTIQNYTVISNIIYFSNDDWIYHGHVNIENSLFSWNSGTVITYTQCSSNCSLVLTNNTFTQSQGTMVRANSIGDLQLSNNTVSFVTNQVFTSTELVYIQNCNMTFSAHNVFKNNIGTALKLTEPFQITFDENSSLKFHNNTGKYGGGMGINCNEDCSKTPLSSEVNFTNNLAIFGGAVYINTNNVDLICNLSQIFFGVTFIDNQAITEGNDILVKYNGNYSSNSTIPHYIDIIYYSKLYLVSMDNQNSITVFPGEYIRFKASSIATCEAILYLTCNSSVNNCQINNICVHGSETVTIPFGQPPIYTNLQLTAPNEHFTNIILSVSCLNYTSTIPINIKPCPLSYTYNKTNMMCVPCSHCNSELYVSSVTPYQNVACLKHGYWYGEGSHLIYACDYPYCRDINDRKECPIAGNKLNYFKLPDTVDEQCNGDRSGTLCRGCKDNYTFTYLAVQCVEDKRTQCVGWLIGLVLVSIVINIAVGIFWIVILKWKGGVALGLTLGPVFFLSNVRVLSFGVQPIDIIVSIFSLLILDNSILGYIPVCTPIQSALVYQYFNYIGPLILAVMVGMIYLMANCYSKYNVRLVSPIHAICLLVFVTFWSLASSSIDIVSPVILNNARFSIEPDIPYLHSSVPWYAIILWIIAVIILVAMVTLIMLIFITPLLSKWFNMNRIKTFLDFYQSCYKDKWRWYCSVYLIVSVIISITKILNTVDFIIVWSTFVLLLLLLHIVTQPYKNKWFNTIDSYLLIDLLMLINFVFDKTEQHFVFAYVLVALPFLYITVIMFVALGYNCVPKKWKTWLVNFVKDTKSQCPSSRINPLKVDDCYPVVVPSTEIGILERDDYREGLSLCSDQHNYYGAFDS